MKRLDTGTHPSLLSCLPRCLNLAIEQIDLRPFCNSLTQFCRSLSHLPRYGGWDARESSRNANLLSHWSHARHPIWNGPLSAAPRAPLVSRGYLPAMIPYRSRSVTVYHMSNYLVHVRLPEVEKFGQVTCSFVICVSHDWQFHFKTDTKLFPVRVSNLTSSRSRQAMSSTCTCISRSEANSSKLLYDPATS